MSQGCGCHSWKCSFNILKRLEARPEERSLTTPITASSCASRTPFPTKCWLATGSPQTIPQKPHSSHNAKMHTTPSWPFCYTAHTKAHLISCVGGATPPPHNHTHFTHSLPFLRPHSPHKHTGVVCLINCHGLDCPLVLLFWLWLLLRWCWCWQWF